MTSNSAPSERARCANPAPSPQPGNRKPDHPARLDPPPERKQAKRAGNGKRRKVVGRNPIGHVEPAERRKQASTPRMATVLRYPVRYKIGQHRQQRRRQHKRHLRGTIRWPQDQEREIGQDRGQGHPVEMAGMRDILRGRQIVPDKGIVEPTPTVQAQCTIHIVVGVHVPWPV